MKQRHYNNWFMFTLLPFVMSVVIRLIYWTMRVDYVGENHPRAIWANDENFILALWHDQLLLMAPGYSGAQLERKVVTKALISQSKDGELIARTIEFLGHGAVRGSSSRGGREALREMVKMADCPNDLVFTPDGPRGPRHVAKMGIAQSSKLTKRQVVPVSFVASRGFRFSSWDKFLFPYPFARAVYAFGPPLSYKPDEGLECYLKRIEEALNESTRKATARLEDYGVSAV